MYVCTMLVMEDMVHYVCMLYVYAILYSVYVGMGCVYFILLYIFVEIILCTYFNIFSINAIQQSWDKLSGKLSISANHTKNI